MHGFEAMIARIVSVLPKHIGVEGDAVMLAWPTLEGESSDYRRGYSDALQDVNIVFGLTLTDHPREHLFAGLLSLSMVYRCLDVESSKSPLPAKIRFAVLKRDGYRCQLCGAAATDGPHVKLEVDHKHPRMKGGPNHDDNIWTLCQRCNSGKGTDDL